MHTQSNSTDNDYSIAALLNQSSRIVLVEEQVATRAGCKTVAQISEAVKAYSQTEYEMKQPSTRAILYVLRGGTKEASGGSLNRNYFSYAPDAVNGTPIIPVTILPSIYSDELLSLLASLKFPPIVNVNEDMQFIHVYVMITPSSN
ncbi:hypothetical protein BDF22DRAFT_744218 [Syncephalis plumigaleata]|nr:hypothetical protein BDF22DRAFT_744218 [Syncephalis plumigaleata]